MGCAWKFPNFPMCLRHLGMFPNLLGTSQVTPITGGPERGRYSRKKMVHFPVILTRPPTNRQVKMGEAQQEVIENSRLMEEGMTQ